MRKGKLETRKPKTETRNSKLGRGVFRPEFGSKLRHIFDFRISNFEFPISNFEFRNRAGGWICALVALAITLTDPAVASAQGCAMCYTAAAAAKAATIKALRSGILILLIPPAVIFIAIFVVAYRRRNIFNEPVEASADDHEIGALLERLELAETASVVGGDFAEPLKGAAAGN